MATLANATNTAKTAAARVVNRGTGAGGAGTNKTGLLNEARTDLASEYTVISENQRGKIVKFGATDKLFLRTEKNGLFKAVVYDTSIIKAHGCKQPDECYIDEASKVIFILEKKFQQCSGSACEKIQTAEFKRWQFMKTFPTYTVEYFYCLSDWFKNNCKREVEWLNEIGVRVFWGDDSEYKKKVVDFMVNYKVQ